MEYYNSTHILSMVDTVVIICLYLLNQSVEAMMNLPGIESTWELEINHRRTKKKRKHFQDSPALTLYFTLTHIATGIVLSGKDTTIEKIRCSLPRVLNGSNSILIKCQADIDQALATLHATILQIATSVTPILKFRRIDIALTLFIENNKALLVALRFARCAWFHTEGIPYPGSLIFRSAHESTRAISFYDKEAEMDLDTTHRQIRTEIQLRTEAHVRNAFSLDGSDVTYLDFNRLYIFFQETICKFEVTLPVPQKLSIAMLLAALQAADVKHTSGMSWVEYYRLTVKKGSADKTEREMNKLIAHFTPYSLHTILPLHGPVNVVDITENGELRPSIITISPKPALTS